MTAVVDEQEDERMAVVRRYDVLDTPPDGAFDRITGLAARLFGVPISLVSIVDTERIWFKSHHGLDLDQIPREPGLCATTIQGEQPLLVTDAATDPRTATNSLVAGPFGLRFYAGVPLRTHDGHNVGTLCVIDTEPRPVDETETANLADLAALVVDELELRLAARTAAELQMRLRAAAEDVAATLQEALLPPSLPQLPGLEVASRYHAQGGRIGGDFYDVVPTARGAAFMVGDVCGKGPRAASFTATVRWTLRTILQDRLRPADSLARLNTVLTRARPEAGYYCTVALAVVTDRGAGGADLRAALGGHPPILVLRGDGRVDRIGARGPIVGWLPDFSYTDDVTRLDVGDTVILYTDGLVDAVCGRGAPDDALVELVGGLAGRTAEQVAEALDAVVTATAPTDDTAFVVLRATGGA